MPKKSNKNINFQKEQDKTYIHILDGKKEIAMLVWHFKKRKWVFEDYQK